MRRSTPPLQSLAAAMSARPSFNGRGRGRRGGGGRGGTAMYGIGRGFPYSSSASGGGGGGGYVTGDVHLQSVRDANLGLSEQPAVVARDGYGYPTFCPHPPLVSYNRRQDFSQPLRQPDQYRGRGGNNRSQRFPLRRWDYRVWEYAKTMPPPDAEKFVVLSYNILADYLANEHWGKLYKHIPSYMMDWEWRKKNILFELGLWSPDVMCFQEVDRFGDLEEELKQLGYNGVWKMRTGNAVDGCAVFWRTSRFKLLKEESIEFNKLGLRDNVAQICVLELIGHRPPANSHVSSSGSKKVVMCNIHVLFNPKRGEIKLGQVRLLLEKAYAVSELWDNAPVVVCGDFNCTPKSPLYNFIAEQKLDLSGVGRDKLSGQASAILHFPRSQVTGVSASPNFSKNSANNINQDPVTKENKQFALPSENQNLQSPQKCSVIRLSNDTSSSECRSEKQTIPESVLHKHTLETHQVPAGSCGDIGKSAVSSAVGTSDVHLETDDVEDEMKNVPAAVGRVEEDEKSLLSAPRHVNDPSAPDTDENVVPESDSPTEESDLLLSEDVVNDSSGNPYNKVASAEKIKYNPSLWTPMEIATATGDALCMTLKHPLVLSSTYTEVQDISGTRDSSGEPSATSCNRCFLGTVDYIWRSEGLQTVKTLAPMPKDSMLQTGGFPTKRWGSDHIALASQLAFTRESIKTMEDQ